MRTEMAKDLANLSPALKAPTQMESGPVWEEERMQRYWDHVLTQENWVLAGSGAVRAQAHLEEPAAGDADGLLGVDPPVPDVSREQFR